MLLALVVQCWLVARTPVTSIDSVRFISIAQSIDAQGLLSVLHTDREQPLFPLVVCGVHHVLDSAGIEQTTVWMRSAQTASVLGLLLAIPAIYLVARRMVGHTAATIGTIAFALLPEVARIGPDGVADAWHLALAAWSVALVFHATSSFKEPLAVQAVEQQPPIPLAQQAALCTGLRSFSTVSWIVGGTLMALALLVRIEAVVAIGAVLLSSLLFRRVASDNGRNKLSLAQPICFMLGLAVVLLPYLFVCDTCQPTQAISRLLGRAAVQETDRAIVNGPGLTAQKPEATDNTLLEKVPGLATFSTKEPGKSIRRRGIFPASIKVAEETADLFGYWVGILGIVGALTVSSQRQQFTQLDRFAWLLIGLLLSVVVWFTTKEGYVTARHLLLLLIPSIGSIGVGFLVIGNKIHGVLNSKPLLSRLSPLAIPTLLLLLMTLSHITPHRAHRSAYREVGRWLAEQSQQNTTPGTVFDTRGWTSLFSTMPTYQAERAKDAFADPRLEYIVVMEEELLTSSDRSSTLRELLDQGAKRVAKFNSPDARRPTDTLIVYRRIRNNNQNTPKPTALAKDSSSKFIASTASASRK